MDESRKEKENIEPPAAAPASAQPTAAELESVVQESWQQMNQVANSFGVDLSSAESARRAKQAREAGVHRLFVSPIVGHLTTFLDPKLTPKLYPREFILVRHALEAGRDMLARAVDAPGEMLCRMIFSRFVTHVATVSPDGRMLHEQIRATKPEDSCEILADIYSGFLPNLDRALFVKWFKHLNEQNRVNVYNTYLLIANGILSDMRIGITDKIAQVSRMLHQQGLPFDMARMLPVLEIILGLFLGILTK